MEDRTLPLPPYGKILQAYQDSKIQIIGNIYIYVGQGGKQEVETDLQRQILSMYLPHGDDYRCYRWPVNNQHLVVKDTSLTSLNMLQNMCLHLLTVYNPALIYLSSKSLSQPMLFIQPPVNKGELNHG